MLKILNIVKINYKNMNLKLFIIKLLLLFLIINYNNIIREGVICKI